MGAIMKQLIVGLLMVPCIAMAEFRNGNELLSNMKSESVVENSVALGYVMGVADASRGETHCAPANATAGQLRDLVRSSIEMSAAYRHYTADILIMAILGKTWPCPNKKGTGI